MDKIEEFIILFESILDTRTKRHITGGVLISASLLFCGLAITVMTAKNEEE